MKFLSNQLKDYFQAKEIFSTDLPGLIDIHVAVDSRIVKPGDTFVCLYGEKTDGHNYIQSAIEKGATGFIVDHKVDLPLSFFQIITDSPEISLRKTAEKILKEFSLQQIAITGSAGKTTTKEILFTIFNYYWKSAKTLGNYNTPIGVPVSLINMDNPPEYFICELSASFPGEIDQNLTYMDLSAAIITGIGSSHLEFFGSESNIFLEKMKIVKSIRNLGPLLINGDQVWGKIAKTMYPNTVTFGFDESNDIVAYHLERQDKGTIFNLRIKGEEFTDFKLSVMGDHFIYDALPCIYLAKEHGMPIHKIKESLALFQAEKGRGQVITFLNNTSLIDESYNANPYSFTASLASFSNSSFTRKIVVIGDMLELGTDAFNLHIELGNKIRESDIDIVIFKGQFCDAIKSALKNSEIEFYCIDSIEQIVKKLLSILKPGDGVLIKASNGVGLHKLVGLLEKKI